MSENEKNFLEIFEQKKAFGKGSTRQEVLRGVSFFASLAIYFCFSVLYDFNP